MEAAPVTSAAFPKNSTITKLLQKKSLELFYEKGAINVPDTTYKISKKVRLPKSKSQSL
jgi:hypothetical protein